MGAVLLPHIVPDKIPFNINPKDGSVELIYKDSFQWETDSSENETYQKMVDAGYEAKLPVTNCQLT